MPFNAVTSNILGGLAGSALGFAGQSHLLGVQWKHQKEFYQNRHQWEVNDLRKAGLNPMLSANSASGGVSLSAPSVSSPDLGGAVNSALAGKAQRELMKKQHYLLEQQTDKEHNLSNWYRQQAIAQEEANYFNQKEYDFRKKMFGLELDYKKALIRQAITQGDYNSANALNAVNQSSITGNPIYQLGQALGTSGNGLLQLAGSVISTIGSMVNSGRTTHTEETGYFGDTSYGKRKIIRKR